MCNKNYFDSNAIHLTKLSIFSTLDAIGDTKMMSNMGGGVD